MVQSWGIVVFLLLLLLFWLHLEACRILVPGPTVKALSPNHWTARELPGALFYMPESHDLLQAKLIVSLKNLVGVWSFFLQAAPWASNHSQRFPLAQLFFFFLFTF